MTRKLASIQRIEKLNPIEGADAIECATVLGWKVVVKKGEFKVRDMCIFCEIDSILPPKPEFEFLAKAKYRIKTVRLRGQVSQGICFPLSVLPDDTILYVEAGDDVTQAMEIRKYEPPMSKNVVGGMTKGSFPAYVYKTDEPRIQSNLRILDELRGVECYSTVKIDGTSYTASRLHEDIDICSRTRSVKDSEENVYWRITRKYDILKVLQDAGDMAIQGEIAGFWQEGRSKIQGNPLGLTESELFVFNVFNVRDGRYVDFEDLKYFCKYYRLPMVPIEHESIILNHTMEELLEMARGTYPSGSLREGLVFRPVKEMVSPVLKGRASFKAINTDYLLKHGDR